MRLLCEPVQEKNSIMGIRNSQSIPTAGIAALSMTKPFPSRTDSGTYFLSGLESLDSLEHPQI